MMKENGMKKSHAVGGLARVKMLAASFIVAEAFVHGAAFGGIEGIATGKSFLADGKVAVGVNFWGSKAATQMWSRWDEADGIRQAVFCAAQNTLQEDVAGKPSFK